MDLLLVCSQGSASSLLGDLTIAIEAKKSGVDVGVGFAGEAAASLCGGVFLWPRALQEAELRLRMAENAKGLNIPVMLKGQGKQIDPKKMITEALAAGVSLFVFYPWNVLIGETPEGVKSLDAQETINLFKNAKKVIGNL